tara:strand:- start:915 stop:1451 length:537 start_codon:yes stop_codon:yes gene_type:complete
MSEVKVEILYVFDFDGTLINTGKGDDKQKTIYKEKTGEDWPWESWWDRKESLDTNIYTYTPNPEVTNIYHKIINNPSIFTVMLTGRKTHLSEYVENVLNKHGVTYFDRYMYNYGGSTLMNKKDQIFNLVNELPNIKKLIMYDDRDAHIPQFKTFGLDLINMGYIEEFNIYHVKDGRVQ